MNQLPVSLMEMPNIFDKLNFVYRNYLENEIQNQVILDYIPLFYIWLLYDFLDMIMNNIERTIHLSIADGDASAE